MTTTVDAVPVGAAGPRAGGSAEQDLGPVRRGWLLYDAANSAFLTTVVTALGGPFVTGIASAAAVDGRLSLLGLSPRVGSLYAYVTALSVVVQVLLLPVLGAMADAPRSKHRLLAWGTAAGVASTAVLALVPAGAWVVAALALVTANVAFGAAIVAYNAYLADVAAPEDRDRVSSRGFASGYAGGAGMLALALAAITIAPRLGVGTGTVVRGAILVSAVWWGLLGALACRRLAAVHAGSPTTDVPMRARVTETARGLRAAVTDLRRLPLTARFLAAFLVFNDAIQAVVSLSAVFLTQELYVANGRAAEEATGFLLALVLLIQVVAVVGALVFARLAERIGARSAILVSLAGWVGVVAFSYAALDTHAEAWALGVVIALVLGGSQALARSLFSRMVPDSRQSSFFAFYELAERGTAWIGTLTFAVVLDLTGSYRLALLSLLVLFLGGGALLAATDTDAAVQAATGDEAARSAAGLARPTAEEASGV
ncbi:MAG: MFS transporter [Actinomycetota bacterium]|nr:MFS transporter [Actinomycetota bacterium]